MQQQKVDWTKKARPKKGKVRAKKKAFIKEVLGNLSIEDRIFIGLPGNTAILEKRLSKEKIVLPKNMFFAEENLAYFKDLMELRKRYPLAGANLRLGDIKDLIYSKEVDKVNIADLDFCGAASLDSIDTILALVRADKLSDRGVIFANFLKGRELVNDIEGVLSLDKQLAKFCGIELLPAAWRSPQYHTNSKVESFVKGGLEQYRRLFVVRFLMREFSRHGYRLTPRWVVAYKDSNVWMYQWAFHFEVDKKPEGAAAYRANLVMLKTKDTFVSESI